MTKLLRYAMNILAIRDHSEWELRRKIAAQLQNDLAIECCDEEAVSAHEGSYIEQVIDYCKQHAWLDDRAFASRYIRSRSRKGYGSQRICAELTQKGIDKHTQRDVLLASDIDWYQLAKTSATRKFGMPLSSDWKEKVKVQRYLLYRGFTSDEIQSVYMNFSD
ncbi:recombination regulator RecX [Musicola keenii]|uniref:recombination regulator RecX n=1 Tax=Musicola keenii TaxID=2884250 RepID=UPI00177E5A47|nr:recombination regulator RecX [Musicola keenii]